MKYIGENAIKKLISLIKGDLATKQPTITASGLLKGDGAGTVTAADTQEATLVDVPNGLLKGDGTTISAAVAGTDYAAASHNHDSSYLKLSGGTLTGALHIQIPQIDDEPVNLGYYEEGYSQLLKEINLNILTTYLVLAPNEWVENSKTGVYECNHPCNNVKDNDTQAIFVTYDPQVDGNRAAYLEANVRCVGCGIGILYFECDNVPSKEIVVNVAILRSSFFEMEAK